LKGLFRPFGDFPKSGASISILEEQDFCRLFPLFRWENSSHLCPVALSAVGTNLIECRNQLDRPGHMTAGAKLESRIAAKVDLQVCPSEEIVEAHFQRLLAQMPRCLRIRFTWTNSRLVLSRWRGGRYRVSSEIRRCSNRLAVVSIAPMNRATIRSSGCRSGRQIHWLVVVRIENP
jgi:hypothetical protein